MGPEVMLGMACAQWTESCKMLKDILGEYEDVVASFCFFLFF